MEPILRDVRMALRRLRMAPGFTLFAVLSLALGIGVSTAVYSAVRTLFWLPLGVPHQEELVVLTSDRTPPSQDLIFRTYARSNPVSGRWPPPLGSERRWRRRRAPRSCSERRCRASILRCCSLARCAAAC